MVTSSDTDVAPTENTEHTAADIFEQKAVRLAKRERLNPASADSTGGAYTVGAPITDTIAQGGEGYVHLGVDVATGDRVGIAGRIVHFRIGGKLCFAALQAGDGSRIQVMASLAELRHEPLRGGEELLYLFPPLFLSRA